MLLKNNLVQAIFVLAVMVGSCQSKIAEKEDPTVGEELPEDFMVFYQKFHDDSTFQMHHIIFPLSGIPPNRDTVENARDFKWMKDTWVLHRPFDGALSGYERSFSKFEEGVIIENIIQKQVDVGMERRFAKIDGEWHLIYYAAMNQLN